MFVVGPHSFPQYIALLTTSNNACKYIYNYLRVENLKEQETEFSYISRN